MGLDRESATSGSASLAPGFRFHPTDEELVRYYLKRKVCGKPFRFDAVSDIDVYKTEPWDLPDKSRLKTRDLEWYFFSVLDKKYGNGSRTNRATGRGYWKTTGKDRAVNHRSRMVGMKKTLVYHSGRAPRGERTNWVMHEYRLVDDDLEKAGIVQDAFVLCRIFQKSGSGPKNGEQYGAPFIEEEWDDDDLVPDQEAAEAVAVCNDAFLDGNDLEQFLDEGITSEDFPVPLNLCYEHSSSHVQGSDYINDDQKPLICSGESFCAPEQPIDQWKFDLPVHDSIEFNPVKDEFVGESSNSVNNHDADYLLDEPFFDATGYNPLDDGAFLETNDLSNPIEADPSGLNMLEEYLTFFDAAEDNSQSMSFDSSKMMGSVNLAYDQESLAQKHANGGAKQDSMGSQQLLEGHNKDVASTSRQKAGNFGFDIQHPFIKQANRMLGSIPAPPAFASEFPTRGLALHLDSALHSSSPAHVTARMIQIRNMLSEKAEAAMSQGWCYMIFVWGFLMLSMSFKIGTCIYASNP